MLNNQIVEESEYSKKLKHPRWQKKRLEILDRDKFTCQQCYDDESTLHIHHKYYSRQKYPEPWDYPSELLITLCERCHSLQSAEKKDIESFGENFSNYELNLLNSSFCIFNEHYPKIMILYVLDYLLKNEESLKKIMDEYLSLVKQIDQNSHKFLLDMIKNYSNFLKK